MRILILLLTLINFVACSDVSNHPSGGVPSSTTTGGDWESSGGAGVACFKTSEAVEKYDAAVIAKIALTDEMVESIDSLKTLEYWEAPDFEWMTGDSSETIVDLVHQRLRTSAALFAKKMYDVRKLIQVDSWNQSYQLDLIDDANPIRDVKEQNIKCRLIQLAVRYTQSTPLEKIPPVKVSFDSRLWKKLDATNQAILILHEQVYLIGKQAGHKDSRYTRALVNRFMNQVLWSIPDPDYLAMKVQNEINRSFGDYIHVLYESSPLPKKSKRFSAESRYRSFRTMIKKVRSGMELCSDSSQQSIEKCREENLNSFKNGKSELTDEEAFLFYYRWEITYQRSGLPNSEIVSVYWPDTDFKKIAENAMEKACDYIIVSAMMSFDSEKQPLQKAKNYCLAAGYKFTRLSSTETDQN